MDLDFHDQFRDCWEKIEEIGKEYASAKADSWHKQELCGAIKASIINKLGNIPVSKAEILAKCDQDYLSHLKETETAIHLELVLKARYEAKKAQFEAYRSLSSLEKATRNLT